MDKKHDEIIEELLAILFSHGHQNALDYGYSFAKVCLTVIKRDYKMMIAGMAGAIGLALGGKKEDLDKFLQED